MAINLEKIRNSISDRLFTEWKNNSTDDPQNFASLSASLRWVTSHCFSASETGRQTNHKHVLHNEWEILESCRCTPTVALLRDLPLIHNDDGANGTNSSQWSLKSLNSQHTRLREVRDTQTAFTYSSITLWLNRVHETSVLVFVS
jgi:hypothetical protein